MNEILQAQRLTRVFNSTRVAVDHVDFSIERGEVFGFLGPNGAGKTTTINMLTIQTIDVQRLAFDFTFLVVFTVVFATVGTILSWRYLSR